MRSGKYFVACLVPFRVPHVGCLGETFVVIFCVERPLDADRALRAGCAAVEAGNAHVYARPDAVQKGKAALSPEACSPHEVHFGVLLCSDASTGAQENTQAALTAFVPVKYEITHLHVFRVVNARQLGPFSPGKVFHFIPPVFQGAACPPRRYQTM